MGEGYFITVSFLNLPYHSGNAYADSHTHTHTRNPIYMLGDDSCCILMDVF